MILTETKAFVTRCASKEVSEDQVFLVSQAKYRNTLKHGEYIL